uniref:EF-hand domain-containing protein n=1 Tax=Tetraselmis sp. GSL018 TaxID=582737 RepID=A0A061R3T7_9CHLO|mmetsp:Transcript_8958/g.21569  ORF Transcript_8958/g.21569 Transcript_8958/m.21569 type:complete len:652 (+) Transcript_8958:134-2089(+)
MTVDCAQAGGLEPCDGSAPALCELRAAALIYDSLVKVREDLAYDGFIDSQNNTDDWSASLTSGVKEIIRRTQDACSVASNSDARKAVLMLTRKDLLGKGLEGVANLLDDLRLPRVSSIIKMLTDQYNELCDGWRALLELQERRAITRLEGKSRELEQSQKALADLLQASQRLKQDSAVLVEENQYLSMELDSLIQESQLDAAPGSPQGAAPGHGRAAGAELPGEGRVKAAPSARDEAQGARRRPRAASLSPVRGGGPHESPVRPKAPCPAWTPKRSAAPRVADKPTLSSQSKQRQKSPIPSEALKSTRSPRRVTTDGRAQSERQRPVGTPRAEHGVGVGVGSRTSPATPTATPRRRTEPAEPAPRCRLPVLAELQAIIAEVSDSKRKADADSITSGTARQTMSDHLDSFLLQKFGGARAASEWRACIAEALEHHERSDIHVCAFKKVVGNELEEEFLAKLHQVEGKMLLELRRLLGRKLGYEADSPALQAAAEERVSASLPEDEWSQLLPKVLRPRDADEVAKAVKQLPAPTPDASPRSGVLEGAPAGGSSGHSVQYHLLIQAVLYRCLRNHERALAPVLQSFRMVDKGSRGVLSDKEFGKFCFAINPEISEDEVLVLLGAMDPNELGSVTFSSCASVLSAELERLAGGSE